MKTTWTKARKLIAIERAQERYGKHNIAKQLNLTNSGDGDNMYLTQDEDGEIGYEFSEEEARVVIQLENLFGLNLKPENTLMEGYEAVREKIYYYEMQKL